MSDAHPDTNASGHRLTPAGGPRLRSDVIDVYIYQRAGRPPAKLASPSPRPRSSMDSDAQVSPSSSEVYFLQLLRAGPPLANTWHPVMGHIETGETAVQCAWRELLEELGLEKPLALHALEQVHPFFLAELDAIVLSPRFAAGVPAGWMPTLNAEHSDYRWIAARDVPAMFMWPGQRAACAEVLDLLRPSNAASLAHLRINP